MSVPSDAGLAAERTALAWTRTSLGVLANTALLAFREATAMPSHGPSLTMVATALAGLLAVVVALYARRRRVTLRSVPPARARIAVPALGAGVVALTGLVVLAAVAAPLP